MNSITDLLELEDEDVIVTIGSDSGPDKIIIVETQPKAHYCPVCTFRMCSRGVKERHINHPIFQERFSLSIVLKQRRWRCTNPKCKYTLQESFKFVDKSRRVTNVGDMLVVTAYQNLMLSTADIARQFHISDTEAHEIFNRYVKMDRLPLTDAICIDEVYLDMNIKCKYALVIQDFHTGDPIDLLESRRADVTEPYFVNIPTEERNQVKYLISDMYNPYIRYVDKYFPNAIAVVDSFHVSQWIINKIDQYIRALLKEYRARDRDKEYKLSLEQGKEIHLPQSDEVYILSRYRWLILSNKSNIKYHTDLRMDSHFRVLMNTYDYEHWLFSIDPKLEEIRDLKEFYILFNSIHADKPNEARKDLHLLVDKYRSCKISMFAEFADLLERYENEIINSFIMVEKIGIKNCTKSRLSNGPIESINRKIKDLKRLGRGFTNFEHFRNRFLYAVRKDPVLNGVTDYNPVITYSTDDF